ncbi:tetraspanin-8 isoform X2 [Cryptomeria japonica]|uniref:tetraspanin-8 isoform X2 n=1 Tax=Cryptomeria japonica TaxID=3369 RepID=UPI0025AD0543|nr:tetraspanin-8 isoform X2 [Cryptomeria japonica]
MDRFVENHFFSRLFLVLLLPFFMILAGALSLSDSITGFDCDKLLQWPQYAVFALMIIVWLAIFLGSCFRVTWLPLAATFLFFLLVFSFTVFAFQVTGQGKLGHEEYRLGDYSNWLQKRVEKSSDWNKIKTCLQDAKVCNKNADCSRNYGANFSRNLSSFQFGCCKPPTSCNFVHVNGTYWSSRAGNFTDVECKRWSNEQDELCYNCDSCKASVLANVESDLGQG